MPRPPKAAHSDPLIAAMIAKLPPAGTEWPIKDQTGWLDLMSRAFGLVYGGEPVKQHEPEDHQTVNVEMPELEPKQSWAVVIDANGYVRNAAGKRLLPKQVNGQTVFDQRGEDGDLGNIIWADNKTGIQGTDMHITS